jgi:hypothetical protein
MEILVLIAVGIVAYQIGKEFKRRDEQRKRETECKSKSETH